MRLATGDPSAYLHHQQLVVTGGGAAVNGSATTPVGHDSTDYVVMLHLTGSQAASVYSGVTYNATTTYNGVPFADVTLWYTGGSTLRQIDYDYDPYTYGSWSSTNITLWFKLQAPLGARPATDPHYLLAWGNTTPTVLRGWANIYTAEDDFNTWNPYFWGSQPSWATLSSGNLVINAAANSGLRTLGAVYPYNSYGPGYVVTARAVLPPLASNQEYNIGLLNNGSGPLLSAASIPAVSPTLWVGRASGSSPTFDALDSSYHIFNVARDSGGNPYFWRDSDVPTEVLFSVNTSPLVPTIWTVNTSGSGFTALLDWFKIRPWIPDEPTVTALTSVSPTVPPAGGIIPWHASYQQTLSAGLQARVDLSDGHLDLSASEMHIPALGPDLSLDHTWDSVAAQAGVTTTAGNGWLDSFTPSMGGTLTGTVAYTDSTGATWPFTDTGAPSDPGPYTSYQSPPGLPWRLSASTAGYTLTNILDGSARVFDANGRLLSDAYGNQNVASYSGSSVLPDTVTNSGGRALRLVGQNGLLGEVQSPLRASGGAGQGQDVTYSYTSTGALLASITQGAGTADAQTTRFGYTGVLLTTIVTPGGHVWNIQYDAYGRVSQLTSPVSGTLGQAGYTPSYTTQFYYPAGQAQVVEGANTAQPRTTTYGLSAQGEPITITNALGYTSTLRFDADHDVTSVTDANNHTTSYSYQYVGAAGPNGLGSTGLLTQTDRPAIDSSGPVVTRNYYDGHNDLVESVSGNGSPTYYQYDGHHSVITTTQQLSAGGPWRGTVNVISPTTGLLLAQVDGRGVSVPTPAQGVTPTATLSPTYALYERQWGYDAAGDLTSTSTPPITSALNGVTQANAPVTTLITPDADGNPITVITPNGASRVNVYDHLGRLVQTTGPTVPLFDHTQQAPLTTLGYDGDGHVVTSTDALGATQTRSYDPLGRLVAATNALGAQTLYTYTATTLSAVQDPAGHVTRYADDALGRPISITDPLSTTTVSYGYDPVGNTVAITTPLDYTHPTSATVESRQYDALDEPITDTVQGLGEAVPTPPQTTVWSYDHDGNATLMQAPNGDVTQSIFDGADRRAAVSVLTNPPAMQALTLDPADNLIQQVDFNQRTHTLSLDGDNRLQQQVDTCPGCGQYSSPITTAFSYNPDGNLLGLTAQTQRPDQPLAFSTINSYNALDWLTSQDDGWGPTDYGYDAAGRLRTETLPGGNEIISTTPDPAGRITNVADTLTDTVTGATTTGIAGFTYTPDDLLLTDTLPGTTVNRQYDADNRLTQLRVQGSGYTTTYTYGYSPQGQTTAITTTANNNAPQVETVNQDALGRLAVDVAPGGPGGAQSLYSYDPNNNLSQILTNAGSGYTPRATYAYTYAAIGAVTPTGWLPNELVALTTTALGSTHINTYGYDQNGDTTAITTDGTQSDSLAYDALGRLSSVTRFDSTPAVAVLIGYNARGLRSSYTVIQAGQQQAPPPLFQEVFTYRGDRVGQVSVTGTATTPFTETFVYRPDGSPLELLKQDQDGQGHNTATVRYWYVLDGHGNVVALTDNSGVVQDSYSYDAWGASQACPGCAPVPQPLRYRGYWYDGWDDSLSPGTWDSGPLPWYWLSTRSYDPTLKRFLQPDPSSRDGVRSYVYCHDAPLDLSDPSGLDGEEWGAAESVAGAGAGNLWSGEVAGNPAFAPEPLLEPASEESLLLSSSSGAEVDMLPTTVEDSGAGFVVGAANDTTDINSSADAPAAVSERDSTRLKAAMRILVSRVKPMNYKYAGKVYHPFHRWLREEFPDGVPFNEFGFPDFSQYVYKMEDGTAAEVQINPTGDRVTDEQRANEAAGFEETPDGYTWHHVEDGTTMQLLPTRLHREVGHSGGFSMYARLQQILQELP